MNSQTNSWIHTWLALLSTKRVGAQRMQALYEALQAKDPNKPEALRQLSVASLIADHQWPPKLAQAAFAKPQRAKAEAIVKKCQAQGLSIASPWRDDHHPPPIHLRPASLVTIPQPPPVLYLRGQSDILNEDAQTSPPRVAIVGSRNASLYGLRMARKLASELTDRGFDIVSGLARGVDGSALRGVLDAGGRGLAVLAHGLDRIYPPEHKGLAEALLERGAWLSEYPPGCPPRRAQFPKRNRLISGLCPVTIVIEASLKSGALITAQCALDQGRDVMALPGPVDRPQSQGCHALIKDGAGLLESVQDIIDLWSLNHSPRVRCSDFAATLWHQLPKQNFSKQQVFDRVRDSLDCSPARLAWGLTELECVGRLKRLPNGLLKRLGRPKPQQPASV